MGLAAIAMRWTHGLCPALLQGLGAGRWARTGPGSFSFSQRLLLRKAFQTPVAGLEGFGRLFCNGNDCQAQNTSEYRIQAQIAPHANVTPGLDGIPMGFPEELRSPPPSALAPPTSGCSLGAWPSAARSTARHQTRNGNAHFGIHN